MPGQGMAIPSALCNAGAEINDASAEIFGNDLFWIKAQYDRNGHEQAMEHAEPAFPACLRSVPGSCRAAAMRRAQKLWNHPA